MSSENTDKTRTIINRSPKGRYVCYNDIMGRGAYKVVYRGYDTHSGIEVAWNLIRFDVLDEGEKELIIEEVKLLRQLSSSSKYIIQFHNAWIDKERGDLIVITELALSGTLKDYILKINNVNLRVIKKWCAQILEGIDFLHEQKIAHRDLKCNNIFINSNTGNIIIGDLGLAKQRGTNFHSVIGTPEYMAPEMYEGVYDEKVDIYAFGMCFLEMITKKVPYCECPGVGSVYKKVASGDLPDIVAQIKNLEAKDIITQCITFDPKGRPTAKELLENNFFQIIKKEDNDEELLHVSEETKEQSGEEQSQPAQPPPLVREKTPVELVVSEEENIDEDAVESDSSQSNGSGRKTRSDAASDVVVASEIPVCDESSVPETTEETVAKLANSDEDPSLISFDKSEETTEKPLDNSNATNATNTEGSVDSQNSKAAEDVVEPSQPTEPILLRKGSLLDVSLDATPIGSYEDVEEIDHIKQMMDSNLKKFCETQSKKALEKLMEKRDDKQEDEDS